MKLYKVWKKTLDEVQSITKLFRWVKEHQGLNELVEDLNEIESEFETIEDGNEMATITVRDETMGSTGFKFYMPILQSELKCAAHGYKFLKKLCQ